MSEVLYTKYRPKKFEDVVGQDNVVKSVKSVLANKTAKTFLLEGPSGTGKTTLARIIATNVGCSLNDIREVDAATYTGVDDMRQLTGGLMYKPIGGQVKALIIDEAHGLSKAAWQSLLKILEEPPAYVYWFLCTTESTKVPETIRTRCVRYQLKHVSIRELEDLLDRIAEKEGILGGETGQKIITLCAKEAHGSPRQALVNLAVCAGAKDRGEAANLLSSAIETSEAIDLAKALIAGTTWMRAQELLKGLKAADANPESVRQVVRAYATTTALGATNKNVAVRALAVMDAFSHPYNPLDQLTPIVLAVGRLLLDE